MTHTATHTTDNCRRALAGYLRPRLRGFVDLDPFFVGVTDANVRQRIPNIVGAAVRASTGRLAYDASVPELTRRLEAAVQPDAPQQANAGKKMQKILALLEGRLTSQELSAVFDILAAPDDAARQPPDTGGQMGEDHFFLDRLAISQDDAVRRRFRALTLRLEARVARRRDDARGRDVARPRLGGE